MAVEQIVVSLFGSHDEVYLFDPVAETFDTITLPDADEWRSLAHNGLGTYVLGGVGQVCYSTDDGATWTTEVLSGSSTDEYVVYWDGTRFVAMDNEVWTSTDGASWTERGQPFGLSFGTAGLIRWDVDTWLAGSYTLNVGTPPPERSGAQTVTGNIEGASGNWTNGTAFVGQGNLYIQPSGTYNNERCRHRVVTNGAIMLGLVTGNNDGAWSTNPTGGTGLGSFTDFTHTGLGEMICAAYNPDGDYWIGGGLDDTGNLGWAYSADGKAWDHYEEAAEGLWYLVDAMWDGTYFWFAAAPAFGSGDFTAAALFRAEPVDPAAGDMTWTRYDLPGTTVSGAWAVNGWPNVAAWQPFPSAGDAGVIEVHAVDAEHEKRVAVAHVEVVAPAAGVPHPAGDTAHVEVHAPDAAWFPHAVSGQVSVHAPAATTTIPPTVSTPYAPYPDCQVGLAWFPDRDDALLFTSNLTGWGMILTASEADTVETLWPVLCALFVSKEAHMAVEVFDVTDGFPNVPALDVASYYPDSTLYNSNTAGWGPFSGFVLTTASLYEAIANTALTPGTWPDGNRALDDNSFLIGVFGLGYEYAFQVGALTGVHASDSIARLTMTWRAARLSQEKDTNAVTIRPYIMVDGNRYIGEWETLSEDGGQVFTTHWWTNPVTGAPWTAADLDAFDSGSGSNSGLGFIVDGTGSPVTYALVQQARLDVEYATTEYREAIAGWELLDTEKQGWQPVDLIDPQTGDPTSVTLVPDRRYMFTFRKSDGHGLALCRLDGDTLTYQPKWTSADLTVDSVSHRVIAMGAEDSVVMGIGLQKGDGTFSLDSQIYATTSPEGLDTPDAWPEIGAYFTMSPVDEDHRIFQRFTPSVTDVYSWLRLNLCTVANTTSGDLYVVIRDAATNADMHTPQRITIDDLDAGRRAAGGGNQPKSPKKWQTIGLALDDAPVLLAGTQYVFAVYSAADHRTGWLVQVLNGGTAAGPPTGPPPNMYPGAYGGQNTPPDVLQLWSAGVLTTWDASTAEIQATTQPDAPDDLVAVPTETLCNMQDVMLVWTNPDIPEECGGFAAVEIERSIDGGATWYPICHITDPNVEVYEDTEAKPNTPLLYRARVFRGDGVPSPYSAEEETATVRTACGLSFTSNEQPELNVFYPDIESPRSFTFPRASQTFEPHNRKFSLVHRSLVDRGSRFSTRIMVRAGEADSAGQPCSPTCSDFDLDGVDAFQPLLDIAYADLSYVCVTNEHGNQWFASVSVESGDWNAEVDEFEATISVVPVTDVPSTPDATAGS